MILALLVWLVFLTLLMALVIGFVFLVLAIVRWQAGPWKYILLVPAVPFAVVAAIVGWVLFLTGNAERRLPPPQVPIKPPPPPGYGPG